LGQEATATVVAGGRAKALFLDALTSLKLLAVRPSREAVAALLLQQTLDTALAGRAMADTAANGRALKGATETGHKMWKQGIYLGHETPPEKTQQTIIACWHFLKEKCGGRWRDGKAWDRRTISKGKADRRAKTA